MFCCGVLLVLSAHTESMVLNSLMLERFGTVFLSSFVVACSRALCLFSVFKPVFSWHAERKDFAMRGTKMNGCLL